MSKEDLENEELIRRRRELSRAYNSKEGREALKKAYKMERKQRQKQARRGRRGW